MRSVDIRRFNPRRVPRGTKKAVYLNIEQSPSGQTVRQTALLIGGDQLRLFLEHARTGGEPMQHEGGDQDGGDDAAGNT